MATQSKYQSKQFNVLSGDLIAVLEKHKAPVDLSLMALGNMVTNILLENVQSAAQREIITDTFAEALKNSVKNK